MNTFRLHISTEDTWPGSVTRPPSLEDAVAGQDGDAYDEGAYDEGEHNEGENDYEGEEDDYGRDFRQLVVDVDGVAETYRWGGMGLEPNDVLNPDMPWIPPADGTAVERVVQRCGCGEVGCGSLAMTIRRVDDTVVWSAAREGDVTYDIGPFVFDAATYESELRRAHDDRPWESRDERVARLLTEALWDMRNARPRSFDWAASWEGDGTIVVSVTDHRDNPRAGQPLGPRTYDDDGGWWQGIEPDEEHDQHLAQFTIDFGVHEREFIEQLAEQIRTTEPHTWPRYHDPLHDH